MNGSLAQTQTQHGGYFVRNIAQQFELAKIALSIGFSMATGQVLPFIHFDIEFGFI